MNLYETAIGLSRRGMSVFPLIPRQKTPVAAWKQFSVKPADPATVAYWWQQWPDCNIGLATGTVSGLFVLDCDTDAAIREVTRRGLPNTNGAYTARGIQYYFKMPDFPVGNRAALLPGIDIRGTGGYVVAPPSVHPSGVLYGWHRAGVVADAPGWLLDMLRPATGAARPVEQRPATGPAWAQAALMRELDTLSAAGKGARGVSGRNDQLNRSAFNLGQLVADDHLNCSEVESALYQTAIAIGLTENETRKTIVSGLNAGMEKPRSARSR